MSIFEQMQRENAVFYNREMKRLEQKVKLTGQLAKDQTKKTYKENKNYASRTLSNSISYNVNNDGVKIMLEFGTNVPYAKDNEFGQKPGTWSKGILTWLNTKSKLGHFVTEPKKRKSIAYLIARSISKKGTKPHPAIIPAWEESVKKVWSNE